MLSTILYRLSKFGPAFIVILSKPKLQLSLVNLCVNTRKITHQDLFTDEDLQFAKCTQN